MVRRCLRRLAAVLTGSAVAPLQQQVEDLLMRMDPLGVGGGTSLLQGTKRPRATTEFSVLMDQLRNMADHLPMTLSDDDLAEDMAVRIAMLNQGMRQLEQATRDQGGLQLLEAREGARTALRAMESARDRVLQGNEDCLTSNWLYTVASLLEEGDNLALELQHAPVKVHHSDVLAMQSGADESYDHMPDTWRVKQALKEMGGLLPFLADNEGTRARQLVAAVLAWVQNQEGTTLFVDSQGGHRHSGGGTSQPFWGPASPGRDQSSSTAAGKRVRSNGPDGVFQRGGSHDGAEQHCRRDPRGEPHGGHRRGGNSRAGRTGGHQSSHPRAGVLEPTSGYGKSGSSLVGGKRRGEHSGDGRATQ